MICGANSATVDDRTMVDQGEEARLTRGLRSADPAAYETLVRRHGPAMLAVARRYLRSEQDAADAVQDAFLSAFRSIDRFAGESRLSTWLHRIVVNACLMKLRSQRSQPTMSIDPLLPTFDDTGHHAQRVAAWGAPADHIESEEVRAMVRHCIDQLPEPYRVVLMLRDIDELDTQETAARLDISEGAVKVRLHRARQALRTLLDPILRRHRLVAGC